MVLHPCCRCWCRRWGRCYLTYLFETDGKLALYQVTAIAPPPEKDIAAKMDEFRDRLRSQDGQIFVSAAINRLPDALFDLLHGDLQKFSPPESISNFSEEARQLGLFMYVVSVILPVIGPAAQ